MKTEPVAGGVPCAPSLAEIIARAAEDAHARLKAQEAASAATQIERARAEVAEALALWGDTPCPPAAHEDLRTVALATDVSAVTNAARASLLMLGHPEIIRVYLCGGAARHRLGADGPDCAGPHGPGPSVAEHPATREETRRRMEPWLALPPERQFEEMLQGGIYQRTMVSDGAGGYVSRYEAQCLGVLEEWERRFAIANRRNEERYQARCKQDKEAQEQEVEREQREQEEARARSERKPAMIERIIQRYGDALTKQGRAEGKILNSEAISLLWEQTFVEKNPMLRRHAGPSDDDDRGDGLQRGPWRRSKDMGRDHYWFFHPNERVMIYDRVTAEAYRAFSVLKEGFHVGGDVPRSIDLCEMFGPVTVDWAFEQVAHDVPPRSAYVARCTVTYASTIELVGRRWLGWA